MQGHEVLEIVLKTADELAREGDDWDGDVWDFVSASVAIHDSLSSADVQALHREMIGGSFLTNLTSYSFMGNMSPLDPCPPMVKPIH